MITWLCLYVKHISFETEMPTKFLVQSHKSCQVSFECQTQTSQGQKIQPAANVGVLGGCGDRASIFSICSFILIFPLGGTVTGPPSIFFSNEGDGQTDKEDGDHLVFMIVIPFVVLDRIIIIL